MTLDLAGIGEREGVYTGEIEKEIPNGTGKFVTHNPQGEEWYYDGEWVNGQMEGVGIQYWPDLEKKYEGDFKNGQYEGQGKWTEKENILTYEGDFKDNDYHGSGKLYDAKGNIVYEGTFEYGSATEKAKVKKAAKEISYKKLARNEDKYLGTLLKVSGKIIQVIEGDSNYVEYRIALDEYYEEVIYCTYTRPEGEKRILENDKVTVYGVSTGLITYESTEGDNVTIPEIDAFFFN